MKADAHSSSPANLRVSPYRKDPGKGILPARPIIKEAIIFEAHHISGICRALVAMADDYIAFSPSSVSPLHDSAPRSDELDRQAKYMSLLIHHRKSNFEE